MFPTPPPCPTELLPEDCVAWSRNFPAPKWLRTLSNCPVTYSSAECVGWLAAQLEVRESQTHAVMTTTPTPVLTPVPTPVPIPVFSLAAFVPLNHRFIPLGGFIFPTAKMAACVVQNALSLLRVVHSMGMCHGFVNKPGNFCASDMAIELGSNVAACCNTTSWTHQPPASAVATCKHEANISRTLLRTVSHDFMRCVHRPGLCGALRHEYGSCMAGEFRTRKCHAAIAPIERAFMQMSMAAALLYKADIQGLADMTTAAQDVLQLCSGGHQRLRGSDIACNATAILEYIELQGRIL